MFGLVQIGQHRQPPVPGQGGACVLQAALSGLSLLLDREGGGREAVPGDLGVREELSLAWQQKVFSKDEFRSFANAKEEDFESPMNKKLVCDAKKLMSDGFVPKNRYYTCFILFPLSSYHVASLIFILHL